MSSLTSRAVATSMSSKSPPREVLKPQQAPVLFTATDRMLDAQACSAPVASNSKEDPTYL